MKTPVSRKIKTTILSVSLLTVMAGAAVAPALGVIKQHFSSSPNILIQLIISLPALFIIITNLGFNFLCHFLRTKTIAVIGLVMYVIAGTGALFFNNILILLAFRAALGISVGLLMPLSTGLLAFYYPPEQQSELMGEAAAMNQLGGVLATLLAGFLSIISWRLSFLVYLFGLISVVLVLLHLPNDKLLSKNERTPVKQLLKFHPSVVGMLLVMMIFFVFPANYAIIATRQGVVSEKAITLIMVAYDVVAFFVGLMFGTIMRTCRRSMKYFTPVLFFFSYLSFALSPSLSATIIALLLGGIANGVGVPYINTIASIKGGKNAVTTVMPLVSASLYLGQFISPLVIKLFSKWFFPGEVRAPYKVAMILCVVSLVQVFITREHQSLPPESEKGEITLKVSPVPVDKKG